MSWESGMILTEEEVSKRGGTMPSRLQLGDKVKRWIPFKETNTLMALEGVVCGIKIKVMQDSFIIFYDVAFKIEGTPFYAVINDLTTHLTHTEDEPWYPFSAWPSEGVKLEEPPAIPAGMVVSDRRKHLRLVPAEAGAPQKPVTPGTTK